MEMEIKEIKLDLDVEEKSRETIINNEVFENVIVNDYWDSHGDYISSEKHTYKNAKVLLEKVTRVYHFEFTGDSKMTTFELKINDEPYDGDVTSCKGTKERLVIKACIGAG